MAIQWFPGHMHVARQQLAERLPDIDVVIELLDARLPASSANPMLAEMTKGKAALKILNKQDLADAEATDAWLARYRAQPGTQALPLDASTPGPAKLLVKACRELVPHRGGMPKPVRVLICGIPNVGKSTLVNTLAGRRKAETADEPGVTVREQKILLAPDFQLYDTPGLLWPRISVEQAGLHLAASGAVGRNAYDEPEVALGLLANVRAQRPERLVERYRLDGTFAALSDEQLLEAIGRRRGCLISGGRVDLHKAAERVLTDFRQGAWGRLTLERPDEWDAWVAEAALRDAEREAKRAERLAAGRKGRKRLGAVDGDDVADLAE